MSTFKTIFKVVFAVALITWLVRSDALDFRALAHLLTQPVAVVLVLLALGNIMVNHWRWVLLLQSQGLQHNFLSALPLTFIGLFFNFAIPGGVGGDVMKTYYLVRDHSQGRKLVAAVTVLWDRVFGLFSMLVVSMVALLWHSDILRAQPEIRALAWAVAFLLLGFVVGILILLRPKFYAVAQRLTQKWPKIHDILTRLEDAMMVLRGNPMVALRCVALSWVSQLFAVTFVTLVAMASGDTVDWTMYFFIVPLVFVATAIPVSPAGVGVGQAAIYFLFHAATGQSSQIGPNAITAWQLMSMMWGLFGAYFYLRYKHHAKPAHA
jgi:uncharacterized protein (TIRG00374 family)